MLGEFVIDRRFCGPSDSGNGGYVCGRLAAFVDGTAEVTLRRPPPLDRTLSVTAGANGGVQLLAGEELVAEAKTGSVGLTSNVVPSFEEAVRASNAYTGYDIHPYPTGFVCGTERERGDAMHIFAGLLAHTEIVASPWIPDPSLAGEDGFIRPEFVWAALDCPGAFAVFVKITRPVFLGRLTTEIFLPIEPGERCTVVGWPISVDGSKHDAGTAVHKEDGTTAAIAKATWITLGGNN